MGWENGTASQPIRLNGAAVRELRHGRGLTLRQLGDNAGLSHSALSLVERDRLPLTQLAATRLATALGVHISSLAATNGAARDLSRHESRFDATELLAVRGSLVEALAQIDAALGHTTTIHGDGLGHIVVTAADKVGLVYEFASLVAAERLNIRELGARREGNKGEISCFLDQLAPGWSDRIQAALQPFLRDNSGDLKCLLFAQEDYLHAVTTDRLSSFKAERGVVVALPLQQRGKVTKAWPYGKPEPSHGRSGAIVEFTVRARDRIGLVRDVTGVLFRAGVSLGGIAASGLPVSEPGEFDIWLETEPISPHRAAELREKLLTLKGCTDAKFEMVQTASDRKRTPSRLAS